MFRAIRRIVTNNISLRNVSLRNMSSLNKSSQKNPIKDYQLLTVTLDHSSEYHKPHIDYLNKEIRDMIEKGYRPENVIVSGASTGVSGGCRFLVVTSMVLRDNVE